MPSGILMVSLFYGFYRKIDHYNFYIYLINKQKKNQTKKKEMVHIKKYALINWGVVCLHKEHRGMRVLNLDQMNVALLCKWV
jgi:hypothetical protein